MENLTLRRESVGREVVKSTVQYKSECLDLNSGCHLSWVTMGQLQRLFHFLLLLQVSHLQEGDSDSSYPVR